MEISFVAKNYFSNDPLITSLLIARFRYTSTLLLMHSLKAR
jgi:hypothetical protein